MQQKIIKNYKKYAKMTKIAKKTIENLSKKFRKLY